MEYKKVLEEAKKIKGLKCRVCKDCNGKACVGEVPGVGGKGTGSTFIRNREKINELKINLDTLTEEGEINTEIELFGKTFSLPVFAAPIGAVGINYSDIMDDYTYSKYIIEGCISAGTIGFTGDGVEDKYYDLPLSVIEKNDGYGIPTIKPWENDEVIRKIRKAEEKGVLAISMDIDAAGLITLSLLGKPVGTKSVNDLKKIISSTKLPFIIKGIMTVEGAKKALEAGAYGIVVSNHGGRVLDHAPSTIEVLPAIAKEVGENMKIFIDGGFRDGVDVFKALALGADGVLIGRPYALSAYGGGKEGVISYTEKLKSELKQAMIMTGCHSLKDISIECIYNPF